jgi:two-component system chemotaxis response regulator CheB
MGPTLVQLTREVAPEPPPCPKDLVIEAKYIEGFMRSDEIAELTGDKTVFGCPDCGGPLRELAVVDGVARYRCRVGHGFTDESLLAGQDEGVELAIWTAIRTFEERATVLSNLAKKNNGSSGLGAVYTKRSEESRQHARKLREFMTANHSAEED